MKKVFLAVLIGIPALALVTYLLADVIAEPRNSRIPASVSNNYESLKASEKLDILWEKIQASAYCGKSQVGAPCKELPDYRPFGLMQLMALGKQEIEIKGSAHTDFAPEGWKKYLHGRGAIAKVKIVPRGGSLTGVFQGAESALLRLSLTYKVVGSRPVAPGLAFKVLRDGVPSANISALVSLAGQGKDFNFFKYPMSNIVPAGTEMGAKMVHMIFKQASSYPEELMAADMATTDTHGAVAKKIVAPRQIFFVPGESLKFATDEHDVRKDFVSIPKDSLIYQIRAVPERLHGFDYSKYTPADVDSFLRQSEHVADIVTTSEFVTSEFGDDGIFFRHQLRP